MASPTHPSRCLCNVGEKAPDGWDFARWTFLGKLVKGEDGKAIKFQDFNEAIAKANEIDECNGITKTTTGYSLRQGTKFKSNPVGSKSGMASWLKSSVDESSLFPLFGVALLAMWWMQRLWWWNVSAKAGKKEKFTFKKSIYEENNISGLQMKKYMIQ